MIGSPSVMTVLVGLVMLSAAVSAEQPALTAPLTSAERDQLVEDFVNFARFMTESSDSAAGVKIPSTEGQLDFTRMLSKRLQWPNVEVDSLGCMHAVIPGPAGAPAIAMLAHVDTSPQFTGEGVQPIVHRQWDGQPISLPLGNLTLDPAEMPGLKRVAALKDTIITASGDTLLGADDKSGVALLFAVARRLLSLSPEERGATVELVFNTDEEIGLISASKLEYMADVVAGYTFDGEEFAQVDTETWHAEGCELKIQGVSVHPGYATGKLVHAAALAAHFVTEVHRGAENDTEIGVPATTSGRKGFIHVLSVRGDVGSATVPFILRDFQEAGVAARRAFVERALQRVKDAAPAGAQFALSCSTTYKNMKSYLDEVPQVVDRAVEAVRRATGVQNVVQGAIRGGTDGSVLTLRGKPTPNIFAGWHEAHGPKEWASLSEMAMAAETALHLLALWGQGTAGKQEL